MRLCRFVVDDLALVGFYHEGTVVPLALAAEAYLEQEGIELSLAGTDDLLELLPPDGPRRGEARALARWVGGLDRDRLAALSLPLGDVRLLVPIPRPPKVLLLAGNYSAHVAERGGTVAEREETFPYVFMKPPTTTLTNPGDPVVIPRASPDHVDWECELGVVIGRRCRDVPEAEALGYVAGYTVVNDVTDRRFRPNPTRKERERDKHFDWLHGKWHDTFLPVGPCILAADAVPDPQGLRLTLAVNGRTRQDATTAQMVFSVAAVVAFLSTFITLEPGDLIATGTPAGVGSATGEYLRPGDVVAATVQGIGTLVNPFVAEG